MEQVVLWKRNDKGPKPMSAPWMESDNEDTGPSNSEIAHSYAEHIGHEYARLRARLHKLEASKDNESMDTNTLAMSAFDALAEQARKAEPHLTREQALRRLTLIRRMSIFAGSKEIVHMPASAQICVMSSRLQSLSRPRNPGPL